MENEICPILVGFSADESRPNPAEVEATRWVAWPAFLEEIRTKGRYSEWCEEEVAILESNAHFKEMFAGRETYFK